MALKTYTKLRDPLCRRVFMVQKNWPKADKTKKRSMEKTNTALSQRENFTPSQFTHFLWWLSTAEKELLMDSVVDRNRYRIIGMTVLTT